jgi:hypothetical protein
MKDQILKIAKVKNEAEFYRKYPSEEAFMKVHGKAFKKAKLGKAVAPKAQMGTQLDVWGNPLPIVQMPTNPNAGTQQMGLNNPQGGTMNLVGSAAASNAANQANLWGTSGTISTPNVLGGTTPDSIKGIGSEMFGKSNTGALDKLGGLAGIANIASDIVGGIKENRKEKEAMLAADQQNRVSKVALQAAMSKPERQKRTYRRPEDALIQPEQLFPTYGVGTNVLTAEDGAQIGGNQTEIQNMYNPGDMYSDLGYEPLSDSEIIKQYRAGGLIKADGGSMIGKGVGTAVGSFVPIPGASQFLGFAGGLVGDALDRKAERTQAFNEDTQKNTALAAGYSTMGGIHSQFSANVKNGGGIPQQEEGGWVSNDWMPQVITQFGEHSMKDLLRPDSTMDTLRTGGNITQNNMYPQDRYALGGELKTTWGGHAETMSHNPYLPGTGETVMFRGKSHEEGDGNGHTGIGVKYGEGGKMTDYAEFGSTNADADVEVERGEPAAEMIDGETGEKNMVVFGNLKIPNQFLDQIGDPKAKGKKFKHYIAGISKDEDRQNKIIDKTSKQIDALDVHTPFDKLKLDGLNATNIGANMKLQKYADIKKNASAVQDAINETAKEHGVDADALAKGSIKVDKEAQKEMAKYGKEIFKAQNGTPPSTVDPAKYAEIKRLYKLAQAAGDGSKEVENFQKKYHQYFPEFAKEVILNEGKVTAKGKAAGYKNIKQLKAASDKAILNTNVDKYFGPRTEQYIAKLEKNKLPGHKMTVVPSIPVEDPEIPPPPPPPPPLIPPVKRYPWMDLINGVLPYIRPSDVDYSVDLYPEMTAAAMNQVEPVPVQSYQPQLLTPYDISYQDQLNEVTAQARAAERMAGQNPAAAAAILGTASGEKNKVLGEQFRQNQAQRMGVYNQNINTLNDAQLKNIGLYADQAAKQSQARSNTKAQTMEIIKSMSDKIAKNKLENKTLQIYENLYNYRFGKSGRAQNYNPLAQFDVSVGGSGKSSGGIAPGYEFTYDASGNIIGTRKSKEDKDARNGSIVRALKNF